MEENLLKKKRKKKCKSNCNCDPLENFELPPCAKFLGSPNPLVRDGEIIYRNLNRLYFFLSYNYSRFNNQNYNPINPATFNVNTNANLQIDLYDFIIGLYINEVEKGNITFDNSVKIHDDENADEFIKKVMGNNYNLNSSFVPSLTYIVSNSNAVIPFFTGSIEISITNFYIILMLSRFNTDYGLLFSDNAYVTNDFINRTLANIYIEFYCSGPGGKM